MSPIPFLEWLGSSALANAMNGPEWAFPVVESLHFIGFAFLIGTIAIVELRLLGLGMQRPAAQLSADLRPWTLIGLALMLTTGPAMFAADSVRYSFNPSFRFTMTCLALAILFHFAVQRNVAKAKAPSLVGALAACISLALWIGVIAGGRMIAFV